MNNILFEKEIIQYLSLPKIPVKTWDGKSAFSKGVAVVGLSGEREAYAVCAFDPDAGDKTPKIVKVFGIEPFGQIKNIFVVPNYMANQEDIKDMDLDEQSKKKAAALLKEAEEIENEGTKIDENPMGALSEWIFDEIHSFEEAQAWLRNYNYRNKIKKAKVPSNPETLKLRLYAIYTKLQKKMK